MRDEIIFVEETTEEIEFEYVIGSDVTATFDQGEEFIEVHLSTAEPGSHGLPGPVGPPGPAGSLEDGFVIDGGNF